MKAEVTAFINRSFSDFIIQHSEFIISPKGWLLALDRDDHTDELPGR